MEYWQRCNLKFESKIRIHRNLPAHTVLCLVPMGSIKNPKTPWTVGGLAVAWWFHTRCLGIIWHKAHIPSVMRLVNTADRIHVGDICIYGMQQVSQFEIGWICHIFDDTLEHLCHSGHCSHQDWFKDWHKCWIPMRWCCLYLQQAVWHRIYSQEQTPLPCFTHNAGRVIVRQNPSLYKDIPP